MPPPFRENSGYVYVGNAVFNPILVRNRYLYAIYILRGLLKRKAINNENESNERKQ